MTNKFQCAIILCVGYLGVAQLVARYLGVVEAASSSLVTQARESRKREFSALFFAFFGGNMVVNVVFSAECGDGGNA